MKRLLTVSLLLVLLFALAGCGAGETLETWPITFSNSMGCYTASYPDVASMLAEEHIIFHGKAVALVEERQYGVILELEPIGSTGDASGNIRIMQTKLPDVVLKKGEEVVLILGPEGEDGLWGGFNDTCGIFRIDEGSGRVTGDRLDSLLESVPQTYSAKNLTLEQVYDLLVELDNAE